MIDEYRWALRSRKAWIATPALLFAVCSTGCATVAALSDTVKGSGKKASEVRKVAAFHAVDFAGSGKVDYRIGSPQSVKIETDDNLLSRVETTVKDGKLQIGFKGNISTKVGLHVTIVAPSCDAAELSGSGDIRISGLREKRFVAVISGSGNLAASGSAQVSNATVTGSGDIDLAELQSGDANTEVTGSGNIRVATAGNLNAQVTGSGTVHYIGSPKAVHKQITGSGAVTKS
jgi:Protein of unknown function (DUF2807).